METLKLAWYGVSAAFILWAISFPIRIFLSHETQEILKEFDQYTISLIVQIPIFLTNLWLFAGTILYFIGNFTVLLLLMFGIFTLAYTIFLHADQIELNTESVYALAKFLMEEKSAWSGATIIVASTVAIGHMWKLNLDKRQYFEKRENELKAERKVRRENEKNRLRSGL